jgi:hypothetical protein
MLHGGDSGSFGVLANDNRKFSPLYRVLKWLLIHSPSVQTNPGEPRATS